MESLAHVAHERRIPRNISCSEEVIEAMSTNPSEYVSTSDMVGNFSNVIRRILANGRKPHICVVGAGVAGLRCAKILSDKGIKATIFEARDRVGGRVGVNTNLQNNANLK